MFNPVQPLFLPPSSRRRVALLGFVAGLFAFLFAVVGPPPVGAQGEAVEVRPGEVLVTVQARGSVLAVAPDGSSRTLVTGLSQPRAAALLPNDAIVVAEAGANRLVAIGGPFGATLTPIVDYPFPAGLAVRGNGALLVTSFDGGRLSTVDVGAKTVTDLATGLQAPSGVVVRNGTAYVTEWNAQRVVAIDAAGVVAPIGEGFQAPLGIALGPGSSLFVTDVTAGQVIRLDGGQKTTVATVADPRDLTADPASPPDGNGGALLVAASGGLQRVDLATGAVTTVGEVSGAVGVNTGRASAPVAPETATTVAPGGDGAVPGGEATDSVITPATEEEPPGSPAFVILLAVLIFAAVGGFLFNQLRKANADDAEAAEEDAENLARLEDGTLHEAFGPCVTEELEAERAQAALDAVIAQIEGMLRRVTDGEAAAADARHGLRVAERARLDDLARAEDAAARGQGEDPDSHPIHQAESLLVTDDGRQALSEYRQGLVTPLELARRWDEAGEQKAIARVRKEGARSLQADLTVPGGDEREARAVLDEAELDVAHAQEDLERLAEREKACRTELQQAADALSACRRSKPQPPATPHGHDPAQVAAWGGNGPGASPTPPPAEFGPVVESPAAVAAPPAVEPPPFFEPQRPADPIEAPGPMLAIDDLFNSSGPSVGAEGS